MRKALFVTVAAAFALSSAAVAPGVASAYPSAGAIKKADEKKDPTKADAALTKAESKDAKKQAHVAHHKAKVASKKAKAAAKIAQKSAKASTAPSG